MVDDGLVNAMPNMQQALLQYINVLHPRLIDLLLDDVPYLIGLADMVEVETVMWPHCDVYVGGKVRASESMIF